MKYWEDRVTETQFDNIQDALKQHKQRRINTDQLYEQLTQNGLTSEEADEFCRLEDD